MSLEDASLTSRVTWTPKTLTLGCKTDQGAAEDPGPVGPSAHTLQAREPPRAGVTVKRAAWAQRGCRADARAECTWCAEIVIRHKEVASEAGTSSRHGHTGWPGTPAGATPWPGVHYSPAALGRVASATSSNLRTPVASKNWVASIRPRGLENLQQTRDLKHQRCSPVSGGNRTSPSRSKVFAF